MKFSPPITQRVDPIVAADGEIERYLAAFGPGAAAKLFEAYRITSDRESFVAALIGRVALHSVRHRQPE